MSTRPTWREKLEKEHPSHGKVVEIPPRMQKQWGPGTMLIPRPLDVDALVRKVRKGNLVTVPDLMAQLAKNAGGDHSCPLTTGIFLRIVAEAAEEDLAAGMRKVTPYWRVLKQDGDLNPKYPGGVQRQAARLADEGHVVETGRGKRPPRVQDYAKRLLQL